MSRRIEHDGRGSLEIRFPFDRAMVDLVKTLPRRRWIASGRFWQVPHDDVVACVDLLDDHGFRVDGATLDLYRERGGARPLHTDPAAPSGAGAPRSRGLFDDPAETGGGAQGRVTDDDYTVSRLNREVAAAIAAAFPASIWVVGEISGFNKNAHRRHVGFQLVERDDDGKEVSQVDVVLFQTTRELFLRRLAAAGDPFRLEDEISVRLRCRVELYEPWGRYRLRAEELDVDYTLGEAARRREEIVRRLTAAGLAGANAALPLPAVPLRVGLITSLGSDAFNDVVRTLQESGFAFELTAHGARVQGRSTEPSVLNALDWFRGRAGAFDVVLICRGGGSRSDLGWFDSERLGRAVATFPLPVIVGIGHEQDRSVLDAVARRAKTPTAAAGMVVEAVRAALERFEELGLVIAARATARIRDQAVAAHERARRLVRAARHLLEREGVELRHRRGRAVRGARAALDTARRELERHARDLPRAASARIASSRAELAGLVRQVLQGARRDAEHASRRVRAWAESLRPRALRAIGREAERTATRERRLHLVDPRRVVERGYAILRREGRMIVTRAEDAPAGVAVEAELRRGRLALRSEGPAASDGDPDETRQQPTQRRIE